MRGIAKAFLLAAWVGAVGGCAATAQRGDVVLLPVPDDPTLTFKVWFKVGSMDDPKGKEGLAYLTGQLLSEGGTRANAYEQILEKLYPMAAGYGVSVDREMTVIGGRTHRDNLDGFFALFTEAYTQPAWAVADFERVKTDTLNFLENSLRYASDEELGKAALFDAVFEGSGYAHPPQGTVAGLRSITLDDVKRFYATYYRASNAVFALGGRVDDGLVQRFVATRAALPQGEPAARTVPDPAPIEGREVVLVSKPDADASISFGFPIDVRRGDRDFYALWLANSWLGEHRNSSSHLFKVIRERRGMNYGDYSYIEAFPGGGRRSFPPVHVARNRQIFEVWIRTLPNAQAHFALRAALREVTQLVERGMSEESFELTRDMLKKYILHFADTTSGRLGYAVDDRFYGIDGPGHLARFREIMDELTREEVNAALKRHLRLERMAIAIVTGEAERLAEALASDAPSPIEYPSAKSAEILEEDTVIADYPLGIDASDVRIVPVDAVFER